MLPYYIRNNIKEPQNTIFKDLIRRKDETLDEYKIRVHYDYLERSKKCSFLIGRVLRFFILEIRHENLDAPKHDDENILNQISFDKRFTNHL